MVTKFQVYRAAWIFGCADAGLTASRIKALEWLLAECYAEDCPVEVAVERALSAQVEAD